LRWGNPSPWRTPQKMKNTKDMQTCVAFWKEINQHLQNHVTCNWANQIHEKHTQKKEKKNKKTFKLVLLFQGCFAMWTCIASTFSRVLWKSHITKDEIFKPLHKGNPNKKQVGTWFVVTKGNGQKPNMGRKHSSKMPMNKINGWFSTCTNNVVIPKGEKSPSLQSLLLSSEGGKQSTFKGWPKTKQITLP
jgi:hypothetical protein